MLKNYKDLTIQLAISITLAITLIALGLLKTPLSIGGVIIAALLGTFILDLDYYFYAYFMEKDKDFSRTFRGFVKHKSIRGVISHIQHNKDEVKEKTLNSAFFQILLAGITILAVSATTGIFVKVLIISTFANSIYRFSDYYFDGNIKDWFWALKKTPSANEMVGYGIVMFIVLAYSISIF